MYKIVCDGKVVYDPTLGDEYAITEGKFEHTINSSGSLQFKLPEKNRAIDSIQLMKSVVQLFDDDELIFEGRPYAPSKDLYKNNDIYCEGELAYFNDSIQNPYSYSARSVTEVFTDLVNKHNTQVDKTRQFVIGVITAKNDTADGFVSLSSSSYESTWEIISKKLLDRIGGYLLIRHENGKRIIDYLADTGIQSNQVVKQGINLLDAKVEVTAADIATVIIPLGHKETTTNENGQVTTYVTIESVNGGKNYIEDSAGIAKYGRITRVVNHDDINLPSNLLTAGKRDLKAAMGELTTITVRAIDLAKAGENISSFRIGQYIHAIIPNLNVDETMLISKLNINLLNPAESSLETGVGKASFISESTKQTQAIAESIYNDLNAYNSSLTWKENNNIKEMNRLLSNSLGLYPFTIQDSDTGSYKFYLGNAASLEESTVIWTLQASGWAVTYDWNNGNPNWEFGNLYNGTAIYKALQAYEIVANQITSGILRSADGSFYVNLDSGDVRIGNVSSQDFINAGQNANHYTDMLIDNVNNRVDKKIANIDQHFLYDPQNGARIVTSTDSVYLQLLSSLIRFVLDGNTVSEWNAEENSFKSANGVFTSTIRIGNVLILNRQGSDGSVRITAKRLDDEV